MQNDNTSGYLFNMLDVEMSGVNEIADPITMSPKPPFIWPEPRWHAGIAEYAMPMPGSDYCSDADLVAGVVVDASYGFKDWLRSF